MSVKEQIDRIEAAKSSLKTAIEGKGVTVPSTTKIDGYGALVESIPAGVDTSDGTLYPAGILKGMVGYSKGQKVTGEMQNFTSHVFDGSSRNLQYDGIPVGDVSAMLPRAQAVEFQAENVIFPVRIGGQATTPVVALEPGVTTFPVVSVTVPKSKFVETFGDATPADVVKDKLFMGAEGYAYGTLEVPEAPKETWVLNDTINTTTAFSFSASFTSNGVSYTSLETGSALPVGHVVRYVNSSGYENVYDPDAGRWRNQAYRKLIFDSAPSGDLLTWLQANGVKQETDLAIQPTKSVNITSNGDTSITPDIPYDAMAKVDVTVDVAGSGTCKLQLVVTTPPTNSEDWSLNIEPLYFNDTTITLDANHLSVEIDISPNRLLLLSTDAFIDSVGTNGWGQFDTLNMVTAYIEYDWGDTKAYVGYAGATGTGRWEIAFR